METYRENIINRTYPTAKPWNETKANKGTLFAWCLAEDIRNIRFGLGTVRSADIARVLEQVHSLPDRHGVYINSLAVAKIIIDLEDGWSLSADKDWQKWKTAFNAKHKVKV